MQRKLFIAIGVCAVILSSLLSYFFLVRGNTFFLGEENSGSLVRTSPSPPQEASELPSSQVKVSYSASGFEPNKVTVTLVGGEIGMVDVGVGRGLELFPRVMSGPVSDEQPVTLNYYDGGIVLELATKGVYVFENSYNPAHQLGIQVQ